MKMYDPEREYIANGTRPLVTGKVFVVPGLYIDPRADGKVLVQIMLPSSAKGFSWHEASIEPAELAELVLAYREDPEKVMIEVFNWNPNYHIDFALMEERAQKKEQATVSPEIKAKLTAMLDADI